MMGAETQAYVNVVTGALERIMADRDDESRDTALRLLGRRIMRCGEEADIDVLSYAEPEWIARSLRREAREVG